MSDLENLITSNLQTLKEKSQERELHFYQDHIIKFNDNDYFSLSNHPLIIKHAQKALENYGMGVRASRLVSGDDIFYQELEQKLAQIKNTKSALIFGSGYLANIGVISSLASKNSLIIADKLVHASIIDAAILSGAKILRFTHNDVLSCEKILNQAKGKYKNYFIITETIFSMDGDKAPIDDLYLLANKYNATLITDDAHGFGISNNSKYQAHIQIGTLSKAIGSYGGYVAGSLNLRKYLINNSRSFIYTTKLPNPILKAASTAIDIIKNNPNLEIELFNKAIYFCNLLKLTKPQSPIIAIILKDNNQVLNAKEELLKQGFLVGAIRHPTVPKNKPRLRITINLGHKIADIEKLARAIDNLNII